MKILVAAFFLMYLSAAPARSATPPAEVDFANSGAAAAQPEFLQGVFQLHNFEYEDAAEHFRAAQKIDPGFALAYWGEAMTKNHGIWHEQDLASAREVLSRLGASPEARQAKAHTEREKQYLETIEILYGEGTKEQRDQKYASAMARLHQHYPEDVDATALYALAILGSAEHGRDFAIYMRAAAVLEEVFPAHPRHPGVVHYLIHSYDDPIHAPLGLRPARIYAQIAPDAGHAQHMTSHIFLALGMWDEVVKANDTAMAVVNRQRALAGRSAGQCGHYNEWLEYGYLQLGRVADARRVLEGCHRLVESSNSGAANSASINSYAVMRAHFLIDSELWQDEAAHWSLPPGDFPLARLAVDYTDTLSAYENANVGLARETFARAETDVNLATAWLDRNKEYDPSQRNNITILLGQLHALLASGKPTVATTDALQSVASKELALPLEFGPPAIYKPTEELLGELYLRMHQSDEARKSFEEDLARAPGRRLGTRGLTQAQE